VLATVGEDASPLLTPMWFVHDADAVTMVSLAHHRKVRNLERDPRAAVVAEAGSRGDIRGVSVEGHAEFLGESAERHALVARLLDRYQPHLEARWGGRAMPRDRVMFRIVPREVRSWGLARGAGSGPEPGRRRVTGIPLKVLSDGDHFTVMCGACGTETRNEYLGYDQGTPSFKGTCRTCGISKVWNLTPSAWTGLPPRPAHR
jgi:PPOX class probable F420-dependent enzyme